MEREGERARGGQREGARERQSVGERDREREREEVVEPATWTLVQNLPQKALRGGIRWTFVDVLVNIWRESPTFLEKSVQIDF